MLDALWHDLRQAIRSARGSPGFSAAVLCTLCLTIGANTALISLANAVVLRPLPVDDPSALVAITVTGERGQPRFIYASTFDEFRSRQRSFEGMSMYSGGGLLRVEAGDSAFDAAVEGVLPAYFDLLRVRPALGRLITTDDAPTSTEASQVVVIGDRLWKRMFGSDPSVVGKILRVNGAPFTVIGVMPPSFQGVTSDGGADFFVPLPTLRPLSGDPSRPSRARNLIGRLRKGRSLAEARAECTAVWNAVRVETVPTGGTTAEQAEFRGDTIALESIATGFSFLRQRYGTALVVLAGATGILLMVGCVNLSSLLLSRGLARRHQLAVRMALGASRMRLIQAFVIESLVLSAVGALFALPLAWWTSRIVGIALTGDASVPLARPMTPDVRVLAATSVVTCITAVLMAALPAWSLTRQKYVGSLAAERVVGSAGGLGKALLVAQFALSLVLVVGAGLFTKTLVNLYRNGIVFSSSRITWARLWLKPGDRGATIDAPYYAEILGQFRSVPNVDAVSLSTAFPTAFNLAPPTEDVVRMDQGSESAANAITEIVAPQFFETVGIARLQGRDFEWNEDARSRPVAIVNATFVRSLFPGGDAVGRFVRLARDPARRGIEIVGVVADAPVGNIRQPRVPAMFRSILQEPQRSRVPVLLVRSHGEFQSVRDAFWRIPPPLGHHFVRSVQTLDDQIDRALLQERLVSAFGLLFAGLALVLAAVGVYGLLAYAVARRTREIGVRMALGATRRAVIWLVLVDGLGVAAGGVALGLVAAAMTGRLIRSLLYDLSPSDPATLAATAGTLVAVATVSALLPAWRASSIDPLEALRVE